ncbi:MAG: hypothetical protein FWG25_09375, partial [Promicromonosporaceae bacterium]|nr:hypothetical protein [Promicromonosporaceae bacterium]
YGFPASAALEVAVSAIRDYLESHKLDVYLAFHDHHAFNSALQQYGESAQTDAECVRINLA